MFPTAQPYTHTIAPNPERLHTRGRRTKNPARLAEVTATERDDWDELKAEMSERRVKFATSVAVERAKRKASDEKAFRLRGYRGRNLPERGPTSKVIKNLDKFKERKAMKARLASATEVHGGLANAPSVKVLRSTLAREPWERKKRAAGGAAPTVTKETRKGSIRHMLRQFRSEGKLPHLTLLIVQALPVTALTNTEKKHLKLMCAALERTGVSRDIIEMLLVRGGVEKNPGPCGFQGKTVPSKVEPYGKRKFIHTCPECGAPLAAPNFVKTSLTYDHPDELDGYWEGKGKEVDDSDECDYIDLGGEVIALPEPSSSKAAPIETPVNAKEERRQLKSITAEGGHKLKISRTLKGEQSPPPVKVATQPAPPPKPEGPGPTPPPSPAPPTPPPVLQGFELDHEHAVEFMVCEFFCAPGSVVSENKTIHYDQERRLVCDRNVKATTQDLEVVHLQGLGVNTKVPYIGALLNGILWSLTTPVSLHWLAWVPTMVAFIGCSLNVLLSFSFFVSWLYFVLVFPWLLIFSVSSIWAAYYYMKVLEGPVLACRTWLLKVTGAFWEQRHIYYVPHAVSNVVTSYRAGTDLATLKSTVGQRLGRLSTLPIPDKVYSELMAGTERVTIYSVMRQPFFDQALAL